MEHEFRVRWYQRAFHQAFVQRRYDRFIEVAHRRWGKDEVVLQGTRELALKRPASYWHCLPEYAQARRALWTAVNPRTGRRRVDEAFPHDIRETTDEQGMFIRLTNGSTWQLIGSDNYNTLVGAGVAGVVFSEWALANPASWGYIRPMVEENGGWAAFITTPRGNNHAKSTYDLGCASDNWFAEISDVTRTGALTQEQLDESLAEYQALFGIDFGKALFEQEYFCSFSGAMIGAYWGGEINAAEKSGRIAPYPLERDETGKLVHPVHTAWDLGKAVNNPIWCFQVIGGVPHIVDFYRPESDDLEEWCLWLDGKGYHGTDYVPHDALQANWGAKRTRKDMLQDLGRKPRAVQKVAVADGINAGRETIKVARFHGGDDDRAGRVALGLDGLRNYRREWDDDRKTFRDNPVKDWAEHIGSAFRYLGLAWREARATEKPPEEPRFPVERTINEHIRALSRTRSKPGYGQ
ncbi:MAG: hypothetical protein VX464_11730 [Pseudomonadota bacterium]|nr:hypothetical protein [Pseudomonadota bacterium]